MEFDEEHYWELIRNEEKKGAHFVKDYLEFEKKNFVNMWAGSFLYDFGGSVKKHGGLIACGILLLICVIRGLAVQFLWKTGSFWYGFGYPFALFALLTLITFPIFLLHRKYKDLPQEEAKPIKCPKLLGSLKVVAAILYLPFFLIGIPLFIEKCIFTPLMGEDVTYITSMPLFLIYFVMGLYVFAVFVYLYSKHGLLPDHVTGKKGIRCTMPRKIKRNTAFISVMAFFISIVLFASWSDTVTENGIITRHFFTQKEYTWEDVDYYTLSSQFDGTLNYAVVLKDGTKATCLGSSVSMSNLPEETYPEGEDDFIRELTERFTDMGIEPKVKNWDKLEKQLKYDYWKEYLTELNEIALRVE